MPPPIGGILIFGIPRRRAEGNLRGGAFLRPRHHAWVGTQATSAARGRAVLTDRTLAATELYRRTAEAEDVHPADSDDPAASGSEDTDRGDSARPDSRPLPEQTPPELGVMVIRRVASRRGLQAWLIPGPVVDPQADEHTADAATGPHRRFASLASMPSDSC
jgi:hypothetical protein